jgi:hypothetical protein
MAAPKITISKMMKESKVDRRQKQENPNNNLQHNRKPFGVVLQAFAKR